MSAMEQMELVGKYRPYAEYKYSGVEWLGEIPASWGTNKLRYLFTCGKGLTITKENLRDEGIPCVNYGEVHSKYGFEVDPTRHPLKCVDESYLKSSAEALLHAGDFVFADTSEDIDGSGNFTQLTSDTMTFAGYHTIIVRPLDKQNHRFFAYLFDSKEFRTQIRHAVKGVKVFSITQALLRGADIWLPSHDERQRIAAFLDYQTARIDRLIAQQQQLIELLKEKRQAVISHAVTKGLNPDAPMKDSGVEWLGQVPEHWVVGRIGYYCRIENGTTPSKLNQDYWSDGSIPWLSSGAVNQYEITEASEMISEKALAECSLRLLPKNTLVVGMIGQGKTRGMSAITRISASINQNLAAIIPNEKINSGFLHFVLQAAYVALRETGRGGNQAALNCELIADLRFAKPDLDTQLKIVRYLKKKCVQFDKVTDHTNTSIALLQERRTALISAAVTGKIDLRDWAELIKEVAA